MDLGILDEQRVVCVELPADLAEECRRIEADVARLDAQYGSQLVGLTSFLVRSEPVASSRIEQVYADPDDVARASIAEVASAAARSTVAAATAMAELVSGQEPGAPFAEQCLLSAHRAPMEEDRLNASCAGRYRDVQNWLGGSDFSPRDAIHARRVDRLTDVGVLREITGNARNRVWVAADVVTEVADLDERVGRRVKPSKCWR